MKTISVTRRVLVGAVLLATTALAESEGNKNPLPDPDILKSANVIDCGQWPKENDQELASRFVQNCEKNSRLMGYTQAWALKKEVIPAEVFDHPRSLSCRAVEVPNLGYYCVGIR